MDKETIKKLRKNEVNNMDLKEAVMKVLPGMIETAGENGVTETEAIGGINALKQGFGFQETRKALIDFYQEAGAERTSKCNGRITVYRKLPKPKEDTMSVRIVKRMSFGGISEMERRKAISYYT